MSPVDTPPAGCPSCGTPYGKRRRCYKCNGGGSPKAGEDRVCPVCASTFYAPRWKLKDVERNQGVYCSRECKHADLTRLPFAVGSEQIHCNRCKSEKPAGAFGPDKRKRNGKKSTCNDCNRVRVAAWREANPERYAQLKKLPRTELQKLRRRDIDLQQRYGITLAQFEQMVTEQGGGCAICGGEPSGNGKSGQPLHIDHDHACCAGASSCGRCIRGLLCGNCNTAIGLMKDDPDRLITAAAYVRNTARLGDQSDN